MERAKQRTGRAARHGKWALGSVIALLVAAGIQANGEAPPEANRAFDSYVAKVEARVLPRRGAGAQLGKSSKLDEKSLLAGQVQVEKLTQGDGDVPSGMLHHWRGTAFAPGATAEDFRRVFANVADYPQFYAPQVVKARVLSGAGDHRRTTMRVKQQHILMVVLETDYDVTSGHGAGWGWSASRSTAVREIDNPGTLKERALGPGEDHGFLWRLNSYWTYEERDGGLLLTLESVSLTRAVPAGLGWAVRPFIESVPRESLEFTFRQTVAALRQQSPK